MIDDLTAVFNHSRAEHSHRLVLLVLADCANERREAYPSITTIAKRSRLGESTVRLALDGLKELGEIEEVGTSHLRTRMFRLTIDPAESAPPQDLHPRRIEQPTPQNLAPDPAESAPEAPEEAPEKPPTSSSELDDARFFRQVFDHWRTACGHAGAKPTRDRRSKVIARRREGYTLDDIKRAIDGAATAAYVNDAGKRFDDLELICRNGSKLDSFIARAPTAGHEPQAARTADPEVERTNRLLDDEARELGYADYADMRRQQAATP